MHQQNKRVIVMDSDSQVLKGLVLLLEDMQFTVTAAQNHYELEKLNITQTDCPALLLLPLVFANGRSGPELVKTLRAHFKQRIPAILFSPENGIPHIRFTEEKIAVLSDRIKPNDLRLNITTILDNKLTV